MNSNQQPCMSCWQNAWPPALSANQKAASHSQLIMTCTQSSPLPSHLMEEVLFSSFCFSVPGWLESAGLMRDDGGRWSPFSVLTWWHPWFFCWLQLSRGSTTDETHLHRSFTFKSILLVIMCSKEAGHRWERKSWTVLKWSLMEINWVVEWRLDSLIADLNWVNLNQGNSYNSNVSANEGFHLLRSVNNKTYVMIC